MEGMRLRVLSLGQSIYKREHRQSSRLGSNWRTYDCDSEIARLVNYFEIEPLIWRHRMQ